MYADENIVIDDALMEAAKLVSGFHTKRETIESALKLLIKSIATQRTTSCATARSAGQETSQGYD
jgi:Arc/MetJ family transcription regulator